MNDIPLKFFHEALEAELNQEGEEYEYLEETEFVMLTPDIMLANVGNSDGYGPALVYYRYRNDVDGNPLFDVETYLPQELWDNRNG